MSDGTEEAEGQWAEEMAELARFFDGTAGLFGTPWAELAVMDRSSVIVAALEETPLQQRAGFRGRMISLGEAEKVIARAKGVMLLATAAATAKSMTGSSVGHRAVEGELPREAAETLMGNAPARELRQKVVDAGEAPVPGARQMLVRRIPPLRSDHGPLAGITTTLWTKGGIPVCTLVDEDYQLDPVGGGVPGMLEPLPDRMVAVHWLEGHDAGPTPGEPFWIGVGDGWAVPLPAATTVYVAGRIVLVLQRVIDAAEHDEACATPDGWCDTELGNALAAAAALVAAFDG